MAGPYFIPGDIHPRELWPRRHNLPLGDGFLGGCALRAGAACDDETLRMQCNLGYAACEHLPAARDLDAVRFVCRRTQDGSVRVSLCAEREHRPVQTRELYYDVHQEQWSVAPEDDFRALAEAAVRAFLLNR